MSGMNNKRIDFTSYPEVLLLYTCPASVLQGQSGPLGKEASHGGLKTKVSSQSIPQLSHYPTSPRATNPEALLMCTNLVCIMNSRNAQKSGGKYINH